MKHVLYISYDGMTDPLGQSQVLPYIIGLGQKGYRFSLISFEKPHLFQKEKALIESICAKHNISWTPIMYTKRPPVLSTLWDIKKLRKAFKKVFDSGLDLVHCRSYIPTLVALDYERKKGLPFIFDMRGFWADERADGGIWNTANPIFKWVYSYFKKKELKFIEHSSKTISLTANGKVDMLTWKVNGLSPDDIAVIPTSSDFQLFECNSESKRKKAKLKIGVSEDTYILSYIGSLGTWYLFDEMLDYFKLLKQAKPNAKFLILSQYDHDLIKTQITNRGIALEDVILTFVPRKELTSYAHASDHSVFFIQQSYSKLSSSPTKMGELLAMGIPVVGNDRVGDVKEVIEDLEVGVAVSNFAEQDLQIAINGIQAFEDTSPETIRARAKDYYDLDKAVEAYSYIYKEIFN